MAVSVKKGDVFTVENSKSGTSSKGDYFLFRVKAEVGKSTITVWGDGGFSCNDGDTVRIVDILSVGQRSREYQGKWYTETSCVCKLELVEEAAFSEKDIDPNDLANFLI